MTTSSNPLDALIEYLRSSQAYLTQLLGDPNAIHRQMQSPLMPPAYPPGWPAPTGTQPAPRTESKQPAPNVEAVPSTRQRGGGSTSNPFGQSLYTRTAPPATTRRAATAAAQPPASAYGAKAEQGEVSKPEGGKADDGKDGNGASTDTPNNDPATNNYQLRYGTEVEDLPGADFDATAHDIDRRGGRDAAHLPLGPTATTNTLGVPANPFKRPEKLPVEPWRNLELGERAPQDDAAVNYAGLGATTPGLGNGPGGESEFVPQVPTSYSPSFVPPGGAISQAPDALLDPLVETQGVDGWASRYDPAMNSVIEQMQRGQFP